MLFIKTEAEGKKLLPRDKLPHHPKALSINISGILKNL
jgi:hypothetical protein